MPEQLSTDAKIAVIYERLKNLVDRFDQFHREYTHQNNVIADIYLKVNSKQDKKEFEVFYKKEYKLLDKNVFRQTI